MLSMKILIIRFSSLGDIVLVSPVTRALAEWFPDAETSVAVKLMYEPIARLLPGVDTIIPFRSDQGFAAYIKTIRQREFDLVIDLHANPRSRMLSKFSGAGRVIRYRKRHLARMGMVYRTGSSIATRHTVDLYLDTLKSLDIEGRDRLPSLTVHPEAHATISERLRADGIPIGQPILGIAPGASSAVKRWPAEYFADLADRCRREYTTAILLIGSRNDQLTAATIATAMDAPPLDWTGTIDLSLLPAVFSHCHTVISNDSGPMHVASAAGTPVTGLFGPTHPKLGFSPTGSDDSALTLNLGCSPCSMHGNKACWKKTNACLNDLSVDYVFQEVSRHFAS